MRNFVFFLRRIRAAAFAEKTFVGIGETDSGQILGRHVTHGGEQGGTQRNILFGVVDEA